MNDLIRSLVFGAVIAAVIASGLNMVASLPGDPEYTVVRCAVAVVKMPCL